MSVKSIHVFFACLLGNLISNMVFAQNHPAYNIMPINYIRTWNVNRPITDASSLSVSAALQDAKMSTQYVDGLGRPIQTVIKQGSLATGSTSVDLISVNVYDAFGREEIKYLPYSGTQANGMFKYSPFIEQANFYNEAVNPNSPVKGQSENYYYSKTEFEPSSK